MVDSQAVVNVSPKRILDLTLVLLVGSVGLAVAGLSIRFAGFLEVLDIGSVGAAFDAGRRQGSLSTALLGLSAGLGWLGARGLAGESARWLYTHSRALAAGGAVVCFVNGLWAVATVCCLAAALSHLLRPVGRLRRAPLQQAPDGQET